MNRVMSSTIVAVITASLVLFIWGFLFWSVNQFPYQTWQPIDDVAVAQDSLKQHFPNSGTYSIPGVMDDIEAFGKLYERGPTAIIHINHQPGPPLAPSMFIQGFALNLLFVSLLVTLFKFAKAQTFKDFMGLSCLAGLAAVFLMDGAHVVWWSEPAAWVAWQAAYNFSVWLIAGLVLAPFLKQDRAPDSN